MRRYPFQVLLEHLMFFFLPIELKESISIEMLQANTANLKAGKYFYDIVLKFLK